MVLASNKFGYVKVVDDQATVNQTDIRAEAAQAETLRYPAGYFDSQAAGGGSCCQ